MDWQAKLDYWNQNNPDDPITAQSAATDHIKPVRAFKDLPHGNPNHHTNLQPIPDPLNGQKSDKWQQIDENFWKINIYENPKFTCTYLPYEMSPGLANSFSAWKQLHHKQSGNLKRFGVLIEKTKHHSALLVTCRLTR